MTVDLDGRRFRPIANSEDGRVTDEAVFTFAQVGPDFMADYAGAGFSDGHLIGRMTGTETAVLIYHCRASDGTLEAGEAIARFSSIVGEPMTITMDWRWLNGTKAKGKSYYQEIMDDRISGS